MSDNRSQNSIPTHGDCKGDKKCKKNKKVTCQEVVDDKECIVNESVNKIKHVKEVSIYPVCKNIHYYQTRVTYHEKKVCEEKVCLEPEYIYLCKDKSESESSSETSTKCDKTDDKPTDCCEIKSKCDERDCDDKKSEKKNEKKDDNKKPKHKKPFPGKTIKH